MTLRYSPENMNLGFAEKNHYFGLKFRFPDSALYGEYAITQVNIKYMIINYITESDFVFLFSPLQISFLVILTKIDFPFVML